MKKMMFVLFVAVSMTCTGQTVAEVRAELQRQGVPHADIVLAQARLETGNFKSKVCKQKHNIFGIRSGRAYKSYRRWQDCVADYKKRISSRYRSGENYYAFLRRIGYAEDSRYTDKLKQFR